MFNGIDHHWSKSVFATCSTQVDVWDEERSEPIRSFTWGSETTTSVRFNPVEVCRREMGNNIDSLIHWWDF